MDLQTGHLEEKYHASVMSLLLFTMKFYCIFFRIKFSKKLFFFLRSGVRKSGFSERCSLMSGNLQGLVKVFFGAIVQEKIFPGATIRGASIQGAIFINLVTINFLTGEN